MLTHEQAPSGKQQWPHFNKMEEKKFSRTNKRFYLKKAMNSTQQDGRKEMLTDERRLKWKINIHFLERKERTQIEAFDVKYQTDYGSREWKKEMPRDEIRSSWKIAMNLIQ